MLLETLKSWIFENLMAFSEKRQKHILISKRLRKEYFDKHDINSNIDLIYSQTTFLPESRDLHERIFCILNDINTPPQCNRNGCQQIVKLGCGEYGYGYSNYCSYKCANNCQETRQKIKNTNLLKLGVECPFQSKSCMDIAKQTNLQLYGVDNVSKSAIIKEKKKEKALLIYGVENVFQSEEIKIRIKEIHKKKLGVENPQQSNDIRKRTSITRKTQTFEKYKGSENFSAVEFLFDINVFINNKSFTFKCKECNCIIIGKIRSAQPPKCKKCNPIVYRTKSHYEDDITEFIKTFYSGCILNNTKELNGKEIDIFLPDLKIGIEFNGVYWHSERAGTDSNYHLNKSLIAEQKGIQLFHIFEDDWNDNEDSIKSQIKSLIGVYDTIIDGYSCTIKTINENDVVQFLDENSLDYTNSILSIGIFYNNCLIQILIKDCNNVIEFHSKRNFKILHGEQILFSHLITIDNTKFILLQNIDHENICSILYSELGFKHIDIIKPELFYLTQFGRIHENDIMHYPNVDINKSNKIWNCGKNKYLYDNGNNT